MPNAQNDARGTTFDFRKMLSRNFALAEFIKPEEAQLFKALPSRALIEMRLTKVAETLQIVRDELGHALIVTSGWRSRDRNARVGGSPTSDHPEGWCADVKSPYYSATKLAACFVSAHMRGLIGFDQLIIYRTHVHISVNPRKRGKIFSK